MARYSQNYEYYEPSPSPLDAKPVFAEDDEGSVLDDKILGGPNTPDVTMMNDHRRPSYEQHHEDLSRTSMFPEYAPPNANPQVRHHQAHSNTLFDGANNAFVRLDAPQAVPFVQHATTWPLEADSGSCTPTPGYEGYAQEYEVGGPVTYSTGAGPMASMNPIQFSGIPYRPGSTYPPPSAVAMSPQSSQGWMSAASSEAPDSRSLPKRSPTYRPGSPLHMRRDGIRKKNARFEIPAERTLSNIDYLINQSNDDQEIKELKQQKRLLRNRQAALDSRQRKKQHTEKLEEEKKQYTTIISELEDALEQMKIRETEHIREKSELLASQQHCKQYIDSMMIERDEMIRNHTLETAELRKKNAYLTEHIQKLETTAMPAPNPVGFSTEFSDFENLNMGTSPWEDFSIGNDYPMENADHHVQSPLQEEDHLLDTPKKSDGAAGFSWNAFYMCLLFGAFIASNSSSSSTHLSSLPQLSDEYRAESANVLKAVLASSPSHEIRSEPIVSHTQPATITSAEMARITSGPGTSSLDNLHASLINPTKQQESEQLFSLSAEQYNSLNGLDDDDDQDDDHPTHMTDLQVALAAARHNGDRGSGLHGKAEVYTRSLMWDRIPDKVVRDFRAMVKEYGTSEQQNQ